MKKLICTRCDKNIQWQADITHDLIRAYAEKVNADFTVFDHVSDCKDGDGRWHYRIFKMKELFGQYDRILHLDTDILISPSCPDLFEEVPFDCVGTVYEDKGSRQLYRQKTMMECQALWGDIGWRSGYINTGVFLASSCHSDIFKKNNGEYWCGFGYDDVHLGYRIKKLGMKVHELDFKWNNMTMFSEPWNGNADRFKSHIIHYAGGGLFDRNNKKDQMTADKERLLGNFSAN
jgi:lipopolysaccharide biosynthesis glycosyltransferase